MRQFLDVIDRDLAEERFQAAIELRPLGQEHVSLDSALGRVLAEDVCASVDVPSFDRSNYDGFAVQAASTYGATEESPRRLTLLSETIVPGDQPGSELVGEHAISIATGAMLPRGADAVVMVEHAEAAQSELRVRRAVTPGFGVAYAGTDITAGETVLREGERLTSRETGVLAAIGVAEVSVWRRPRVGILSTGDELIAPGAAMRPGKVYDSNARILADAVHELGAEAVLAGIVPDDRGALRSAVQQLLATTDIVLLSGGTSKGEGDLCYQVIEELDDPGIVVHGVALKPGKPICLAASRGKPVVILPGFPTSAIFTFHEFVAPIVRSLGGQPPAERNAVAARLAHRVNSEIGRTEYLLVGLLRDDQGLMAYSLGKGSGSVTTFSRADGFVTIPREVELLPEQAVVDVQLLGRGLAAADLVVVGSHCVGLDLLFSKLQAAGHRVKFLAVGSTAGLAAVERRTCDVAGIHLLDPQSGEYNRPFLPADVSLVRGYRRRQGVVFRADDQRFVGRSLSEVTQTICEAADCLMVNRNQGSGTRILIDELLAGARPSGYAMQPTNHNAVAAAVAQKRADWGVAIESVADRLQLAFCHSATNGSTLQWPRGDVSDPLYRRWKRCYRNNPFKTGC